MGTLAERLSEEIERRGLSNAKAAMYIGIDSRYLYRAKKGLPVSLKVTNKIQQWLNAPPETEESWEINSSLAAIEIILRHSPNFRKALRRAVLAMDVGEMSEEDILPAIEMFALWIEKKANEKRKENSTQGKPSRKSTKEQWLEQMQDDPTVQEMIKRIEQEE